MAISKPAAVWGSGTMYGILSCTWPLLKFCTAVRVFGFGAVLGLWSSAATAAPPCARQDSYEYAKALRVKNCLYADPNAKKAGGGETIVSGSVSIENISGKDLILEYFEDHFRGPVIRLYCSDVAVSRSRMPVRVDDPTYVPVGKIEYGLNVGATRTFDFKISDLVIIDVPAGAVCSAYMTRTVPFRYPHEPAGLAWTLRRDEEARLGQYSGVSKFEGIRIR